MQTNLHWKMAKIRSFSLEQKLAVNVEYFEEN